jgi:septin family protein
MTLASGYNAGSTFAFRGTIDYFERQYDATLVEESRITCNSRVGDNRVHNLLYFISAGSLTPNGDSV